MEQKIVLTQFTTPAKKKIEFKSISSLDECNLNLLFLNFGDLVGAKKGPNIGMNDQLTAPKCLVFLTHQVGFEFFKCRATYKGQDGPKWTSQWTQNVFFEPIKWGMQ
uniref:Uncharacterized protein n=1 Tax=Cacopsylla melanoneura TaxID=428564 RepID=A0A8D8R877_9HEMI